MFPTYLKHLLLYVEESILCKLGITGFWSTVQSIRQTGALLPCFYHKFFCCRCQENAFELTKADLKLKNGNFGDRQDREWKPVHRASFIDGPGRARAICSSLLLDLHYSHTLGAHVPFMSLWLCPLAHKTRALMHLRVLESLCVRHCSWSVHSPFDLFGIIGTPSKDLHPHTHLMLYIYTHTHTNTQSRHFLAVPLKPLNLFRAFYSEFFTSAL